MPNLLSYPLTFPQQSIWDIERFYKNTSYANLAMTTIIREHVKMDFLEDATNHIIQQHEGLRLRIKICEGEPRQYISEIRKHKFDCFDFSYAKGSEDFADWQDQHTRKPFQLLDADLFYIAFVRLSNNEVALYSKFHHLIADAWTIIIIIRDILNTYKDLVNHGPLLLEQKSSYFDYILKDMKYRNSPKYEEHKIFWQQMYKTVPEFILLKERAPRRDNRAKRRTQRLSPDLTEEIKCFSTEFGVSDFIILLAVFALYIAKTTFKYDLVIGTPVLNRANHQDKNIAGMFVSNIPFRITINPKWDFATYLREVFKVWKILLRNQRYPYQEILKDFREVHGHSGSLTDVFFSYQNAKFKIDDLNFESFWHFNGQEINALSLHVSDWKDEGSLKLDYDYLIGVLTETEVEQIHYHYINLLKNAMLEPFKLLSQLSLLTIREKDIYLQKFNLTKLEYPKDKTIQQLFEEQAAKTPQAIALIIDDQRLTYKTLNEQANQLANVLRLKGVKPDNIVGILVHRSLELMIGILGIIKAGGAYLPLDPYHPIARIEEVLRDSRTQLVLTSQALCTEKEEVWQLGKTLGLETINLDDAALYAGTASNLVAVNKPTDLAYVIYTSGSTGKPKGVMIEHRSVNNFIHAITHEIPFLERKVIVSLTTVSFDIFVMETLLPLSQGLCVIMANEKEQQIPQLLFDLIDKHNVKMLQATPSKIQSILKDPYCPVGLARLSELFIGGEKLSEALLKDLQKAAPAARIYNMYGPTETTVWSMYKDVTQVAHVTIGKALANTGIYILDALQELVPMGITGEIYIGGEGLARGYLYREDLTKERFVPDPFHEGQTLYKTGDLGRWAADGEIEHLGRNDDQVKIRGFRIELREIEKCLLEHELLQDVAVVSREDGKNKNYLCAYLVGKQPCSILDIRAYLAQRLPDYMIPAKFVWLDAIPLTPNAKVDKKALPDPALVNNVLPVNNVSDVALIAPRDSLEEELARLWSIALDVEQVSLDDNFFVLGGDSLAIIEILTGIWSREWDLSAQDFYDYPTIRQLSEKVRGKIGKQKESKQPVEEFPSIHLEYDDTPPDPIAVQKGNVLLTGATGFLGIHLLWELLKSTSCTIYCIVRGGEAETRLMRLLKFYFSESLSAIDYSRIRVVNGDISLEKFGLSVRDYEALGDRVSTVIHAAGIVKHYGTYAEFEKINVRGTQEVIAFCLAFRRPMNHVSTISIAGNQLVQATGNVRFSEAELYVGQNYQDNPYVQSKFDAEVYVLKAINSELLQAAIFRVGMLSGRYTDGHFQENIHKNAFYQKLKSLLDLKAVPRDQLHQELEFTPVDVCAKGIVNIIRTNTKTGRVFHMFNHKKIEIKKVIDILYSQGIEIELLDKVSFYQLVEQWQKEKHNDSLNGLVLDLTEEHQSHSKFKIEVLSNITQNLLAQTGFEWPDITKDYLNKILDYMKRVDFLR
ncbi:amino acid adenylation domain-containing protein [Desulfosporosinus sp. PR]|uniref:non-ribosomal peptide synthetase family protein n=1 Tax=Candidatus Desulfosporosinus nitrosoreducens TaxID=3401928 RepID=UPI0027F8708D|nr:amino acid adenylation domain-containing protein [Desulfosporosinus sp. PR]MDQ7093806.1 amino acid adenylation domain-containing protein [Desulfosporosinus sp. PR]